MDGIYFLIIWISGALLHTLYDLRIKPYLADAQEKEDEWPYV